MMCVADIIPQTLGVAVMVLPNMYSYTLSPSAFMKGVWFYHMVPKGYHFTIAIW